jgi:Flp pilus assembly protein TadD/GGDEF domain-containing protein
MKKNKQGLIPSLSSVRQFLFYKTNSEFKDAKTDKKPLNGMDRLKKAFPKILIGKTFIETATKALDSSEKFGAMVIKIDGYSHCSDESSKDHRFDLLVDVAKTIDTLCKKDKGIWGHLNTDVFGCFFPEKDQTACLRFASKIQKSLSQYRHETISVGIAAYPTKPFSKKHIIENAHKALDHAAFFGPNSTVCFDAVSLNISGDKCYQAGDIHGAVREFKTALILDPMEVNVHNSLGVCYGEMENFSQALEEFETTMQLDPTEIMAIYNAGIVNMLMGNREKALEFFHEAHRRGKDIFEVAFQIGKLYLENGDPEKGKCYLQKAVSLHPVSGSAFRYLGDCYDALNQTDAAVQAYEKAIKKNPNDAASLSALGYLYHLQGVNPEIALMFCQKSVEISPENGCFRNRLGQLYLKQKRLDDALNSFKKATTLGYNSLEFIEKTQELKMGELEN